MEDRRCPRCKEYMPLAMYEPPVSMCMVCYSRIPANAGLTLTELRDKAHRSFPALRRLRKEEARETLEHLTKQVRSHPTGAFQAIDEQIQQASDAGLKTIACERCKQDVEQYYMRQNHGIIEIICHDCKENEVNSANVRR